MSSQTSHTANEIRYALQIDDGIIKLEQVRTTHILDKKSAVEIESGLRTHGGSRDTRYLLIAGYMTRTRD